MIFSRFTKELRRNFKTDKRGGKRAEIMKSIKIGLGLLRKRLCNGNDVIYNFSFFGNEEKKTIGTARHFAIVNEFHFD